MMFLPSRTGLRYNEKAIAPGTDRSLERCLAGGGLLGGKDPAGRFALVVITSLMNGFAACFARTPNQRANGQPDFLCGFSADLGLISSSASRRRSAHRRTHPGRTPAGDPGRGSRRAAWKIASLSGGDAVMGASEAGRMARPEHNARNRGQTRNVFSSRSVSSCGRTYGRSPLAAGCERMPSPSRRWRWRRRARAAVCSVVRPAKNRSLTSSAFRGSSASSWRRASSRASRRSAFSSSSRAGSMSSKSSRRSPPPAFMVCLCLRAVDQDAAHGLGGGGEEVPAAGPVLGRLPAQQSQIRLMHQGGCLQGLAGPFVGQLLGGEPAQLVVYERQQLLRSVRVAVFDRGQDLRDIGHAVQLYPGGVRAATGATAPLLGLTGGPRTRPCQAGTGLSRRRSRQSLDPVRASSNQM